MRGAAAGCLMLAMGLGGCATLARGTQDEVAVLSEPAGAAVTSSLGVGCDATPCTLTVSRDAAFSVTVAKPGYVSQTVAVATRLSGPGAALATENLATAGMGLAVDAATGAALEHAPNPVSVTLASLAPPAAAQPRPPAAHPRRHRRPAA